MGHKELVVGSSFLDCRVDITLQLLCARSRLYYVPRIFTFRTLFSRASSLVFCYLFIIWYYVGTHSFETAQAAISQFTAIRVLTVVVQKQPDVTLSHKLWQLKYICLHAKRLLDSSHLYTTSETMH